jgi:hypothetical protein
MLEEKKLTSQETARQGQRGRVQKDD